MNTNKKMMNSNKKISSNLQFSEIESLIKKYKLETVNINIKFEDNSLEKPTKPLVVENIDIPASKNSKINIFELTFFTPLATPDSKYFKNIKINNSINIFRFKGSTSPFKEEIFEIEFKSPSNIYDKQGKLILDSLNFDKRDSDIKEFFNYLVREKYENVHHLKGNESESISLGFYETSKINFILIENVNSKIINLTSKLPITVVAFNSNFKLEYKYQKIQNEPLIKIEKSKHSCPTCPKHSCPECIKEPCPKQSCPVCNKEECPKHSCPECIKEPCPKHSCPECIKEPCPKHSCPECPSNTGWIIATLILLLFAIVLFILKMRKSKK